MTQNSKKRERTFDELEDYTRNRLHAVVMSINLAKDYLEHSLEDIDELFKDLPELFVEKENTETK